MTQPSTEYTGFRPYQVEDYANIEENYYLGIPNQLVVQATGLGKTMMMAGMGTLLRRLSLTGKIFVLVHRQELADQTKKAFERANPHLKVAIEQGSRKATGDYDILIGSVQTLGTAQFDQDGNPVHKKRMLAIDPNLFSAVLVDETHRAPAKTFRSVIMYMGVYPGRRNTNPERLFIGYTATPNRTDNQGLEEFYSVLSANRDIIWGIENKWLCEPRCWRINTHIDLDQFDLGISSGEYGKDFSKKDLEKAVNIPARNKLVIEKFIELSEGYRGIFFCVDVQHATDLCSMANSMGIPSASVFGETPSDDRKQILADHRSGKYRCLFSVNCFIEGYDDPGVVVACMCRPTKSSLFYQQAIGRVLRLYPSPEDLAKMRSNGREPDWVKPYAIILDFCDLSSKHTIITASSIFGLGSKFDCKGEGVLGQAKKMQEEMCKLDEQIQKAVEQHKEDIASIEDLKAIVERIDLLRRPQVSPEAAKYSDLEWVKVNDAHEISLVGNEVIRIRQDTLGMWQVTRSIKGSVTAPHSSHDLGNAIKWAESNLIPPESYDLLNANAKWKRTRPSPEQMQYLIQLRPDMLKKFTGNKEQCMKWIKDNYDKGTVSQMISEAKNARGH